MNALRERFANRLRPMQFIDLKQVLAIEKRAYDCLLYTSRCV